MMTPSAIQRSKILVIGSFVVIGLLPTTVQANSFTPVASAFVFNLLFGNFLIGILEGLILAWLFKLSRIKCCCALIAANYFSAFAGGIIISMVSYYLFNEQPPLEKLLTITHPLYIFLYAGFNTFLLWILTIVLEFPFVLALLKGENDKFRKAFRGSLIIQTVSYILLAIWCGSFSTLTLYTENDIIPASEISISDPIDIYFISSKDGAVYGGPLNTQEWEKVYQLDNPTPGKTILFIQPSQGNTNLWNLYALQDGAPTNIVLIKENFAQVAAPTFMDQHEDIDRRNAFPATCTQSQLGGATNSSWRFNTLFPRLTLRAHNEKEDRTVYVGFEIPFCAFRPSCETHLPTDKVLFQLGNYQVCLYDPIKKQIALVAHGFSPIAVMHLQSENNK